MRTAGLALILLWGFSLHAQAPSYVQAGAALEELLQSHRYEELELKLPQAADLKQEQRKYFEGALALRQNRLNEADAALVTAVNTQDPDLSSQKRPTALTSEQVLNAFYMLATTHIRAYHYSRAAFYYDSIDKIWGANNPDIGADARSHRHTVALLKDVPAQSSSVTGEATLPNHPDGYPVQIGDQTFHAVLDTGATYSTLSETSAKSWGVTPLAGTITVSGYGGKPFSAHPGVIPVLRIGTAELHNVVVMIVADKDVMAKALLGYPVAAALGRLTFHKDGSLTIGSQPGASEAARLWIGDELLLISLGTVPGPDHTPRLFVLDTGSHSTFLTDHYLEEHKSEFPGKPDGMALLFGGGGLRPIPAYSAAGLPLWFGSTQVLLNGQHILTATQGGEPEKYFGLIGRDLLDTFSSYTIDLRQMKFSIEKQPSN